MKKKPEQNNREEMAGKFWYWGGFSDLQTKLNCETIDGVPVRVLTAAVGDICIYI